LGEAVGGGGGAPGGVQGRRRRPSRGGGGGTGRRVAGGGWRGMLGATAVGELLGGGGFWKHERAERNETRGLSAGLHKRAIPVGQSKGRRELTYPCRPVSGPTGVNLSSSASVRADGS
jgi:hypothetical protein